MVHGDMISPKKNASPNVGYNLVSVGRGTSGVVEKGERGLQGGPEEQYKDRSIGTKRFDLTNRSVNRGRGMR